MAFPYGINSFSARSVGRECRLALGRHTFRAFPNDAKLLQWVVGPDGDEEGYFYGGFKVSFGIRAALRLVGKRISDFNRILDFGCGSARVLHWFQNESGRPALYGCDVSDENIDWCENNVPFAQFTLNKRDPPLPYPSEFFDFIYGISVVTHLDEEHHLAWLSELGRVLKPGGIVMLTVHGQHAAEMDLSKEDYQEFVNRGFFYRRAVDRRTVEGLPDYYQVAFHSHPYIHRNWSQWFELVGCIRHGTMYKQEAILLFKGKDTSSDLRILYDLPVGVIEEPIAARDVQDALWVRGWAYYPDGRQTHLDLWIDSTLIGRVICSINREDVAILMNTPSALKSGFEFIVPLRGFGRGPHVVWVSCIDDTFPVSAKQFVRKEGRLNDLKRMTESAYLTGLDRIRRVKSSF
jgi:SAM-dependent methyltransferase